MAEAVKTVEHLAETIKSEDPVVADKLLQPVLAEKSAEHVSEETK